MLKSGKFSLVPVLFLATAAFAAPALAQTTTATGTGVGVSESNSAAGAVAVANGGNNLTVNNPANTTATVNSRVSGTQTIKSAPAFVAPGLTAAGLETCLGSASGGFSAVGFGLSGGSTYRDEDCTARLDARTLYSMGLKGASVARLCARPDIWRSMPDICQRYWPVGVPLPAGVAVVVAPGGPAAIVMTANSSGPIEVIEGKTGITRLCDNYDAARQRCIAWTGAKQRMATATPTRRPKPLATASAAARAPAVQAIEAATAPEKKD
jgi:hypothetical protein